MDQEEFALVEISEEQRIAAFVTINRHATDFDDKVMLCQMLGIAPTPERATCVDCGAGLTPPNPDAARPVRRGSRCHACYRRDLRARKAAES